MFTELIKSFVADILMPPISIILPLNKNIEEKFAVLKTGPNYNKSNGYNTLHQAQEDGAVVMSYGFVRLPNTREPPSIFLSFSIRKLANKTCVLRSLFIYQMVSLVMVGISLYGLAHLYALVSHDNIIKQTKKCKYCRKRINEKVRVLLSLTRLKVNVS
jgi:large conductance mechanosensitive channel